MSWRIEEADALALLRELPDGWAQLLCRSTAARRRPRTYARDPRRGTPRASRRRHAVGSPPTRAAALAAELREEGWTQQAAPKWAERATTEKKGAAARMFLFTKQRRFSGSTLHALAARDRSSSALCVSVTRSDAACPDLHSRREHERGLALIKRLPSWPALRCWRVGRAARPTGAPGPVRALSQSGVRRARTTTPAGAVWYSTRSMTGPASQPPRRRSTPGAASSGSPSPQRRVSADDGVARFAARLGRSRSQSAARPR